MKVSVPRFISFDQRDPDNVPLYPFPLPEGERVVALTNGTTIDMYSVSGNVTSTRINGFVPHIEAALLELYSALYSENDPRYTVNGEQVVFPLHAFDMMLHDRGDDGRGKKTIGLLSGWFFDDEWPAPPEAVCAVVLAHLPGDLFRKGSDTVDIWQRRAHLKRALVKIGMANPYANPRPILRYNPIAPEDWDLFQKEGCAGRNKKFFWQQVDNCFKKGYQACLIIDVWQPWSSKSNAFQLITEEDSI
jgi:hypothetical protein